MCTPALSSQDAITLSLVTAVAGMDPLITVLLDHRLPGAAPLFLHLSSDTRSREAMIAAGAGDALRGRCLARKSRWNKIRGIW